MKTGMEIPLIILALVLGLVVLWSTWGGYQVEIAAAQVQATAVGGSATAPAMLGAELVVKAIVGLVLGGVVTAGIGYGIAWLRRQSAGQWKGGPNARWKKSQPQPVERSPRGPSEGELLRAMLMRQYMQSGGPRPDWAYKQEDDDEPVLRI